MKSMQIMDPSELLIVTTSADNVLCVAKPKEKDFSMRWQNAKNIVLVEFLHVPEIVCKANKSVWLVLLNVENTKTAMIWNPTS